MLMFGVVATMATAEAQLHVRVDCSGVGAPPIATLAQCIPPEMAMATHNAEISAAKVEYDGEYIADRDGRAGYRDEELSFSFVLASETLRGQVEFQSRALCDVLPKDFLVQFRSKFGREYDLRVHLHPTRDEFSEGNWSELAWADIADALSDDLTFYFSANVPIYQDYRDYYLPRAQARLEEVHQELYDWVGQYPSRSITDPVAQSYWRRIRTMESDYAANREAMSEFFVFARELNGIFVHDLDDGKLGSSAWRDLIDLDVIAGPLWPLRESGVLRDRHFVYEGSGIECVADGEGRAVERLYDHLKLLRVRNEAGEYIRLIETRSNPLRLDIFGYSN